MIITKEFFQSIGDERSTKFWAANHPQGLELKDVYLLEKSSNKGSYYSRAIEYYTKAKFDNNLVKKSCTITGTYLLPRTIFYNEKNQVREVHIHFSNRIEKTFYRYDYQGRVVYKKSGSNVFLFDYDNNNNLTHLCEPDGTKIFWEYDDNNNLIFFKRVNPDGSSYRGEWRHDSNNNIIWNRDNHDREYEYHYNGKNLVWAKLSNGTEYEYHYNGKYRYGKMTKLPRDLLERFPEKFITGLNAQLSETKIKI